MQSTMLDLSKVSFISGIMGKDDWNWRGVGGKSVEYEDKNIPVRPQKRDFKNLVVERIPLTNDDIRNVPEKPATASSHDTKRP